ncbi:MAG TPA: FtsH protease activity modulator HflK [Pararobbsia sp.]|nr:FtsH protease activity modulator HflK [Pararobbsia sp.]
MNDPRGGRDGGGPGGQGPRDPQGGPPDLEELWRDFNRRLSRLFGRKGGGSPSPRRGHTGRNATFVVVGLVIAVWLGNGVFVVPDGQAGVVTRFGQYRHTTAAGVQWRLPFPIEADEIVNISQLRSVDIGRSNVVPATDMKDASMLTRDGDIVDLRFTVQFRINDARAFLFDNVDPESAVTQAAQVAARALVGSSSLDVLVNGQHAELATQLQSAIQASLDRYQAGIGLIGVTVQSLQTPEQVQAANADATKAVQDSDKLKADARAYAEQILPKARTDAASTIQAAGDYKVRVVTEAQNNAQKFLQALADYDKAPVVTRERMYIDTMQAIYTNATKVLVDTHSGNNTVYLPLDKLLAANGVTAKVSGMTIVPPSAASAAGAPAAPAAPAPGSDTGADTSAAASAVPGTPAGPAPDNASATAPGAATAAPDNGASTEDRSQLFRSRDASKDIR